MKMSLRRFSNSVLSVALAFMLLPLNGCKIYDDIVAWIQSAFTSEEDYYVSVIDCKIMLNPTQIIGITPDVLSTKLTNSVKEGITDVSQMPKFRHIRLVDLIPKNSFAAFYKGFLDEKATFEQKKKLLRDYCDKYGAKIIVWGATMGDDKEIAFLGWMYRRDLDVISQTSPQTFNDNESPRMKEAKVKRAVADLLQRSLDDRPIGGTPGKVAADMSDNKDGVISTAAQAAAWAGSAIILILQAKANGSNGGAQE